MWTSAEPPTPVEQCQLCALPPGTRAPCAMKSSANSVPHFPGQEQEETAMVQGADHGECEVGSGELWAVSSCGQGAFQPAANSQGRSRTATR